MTDPLDLDAIEALAKGATPGPWHSSRHYIGAGEDPTDPDTEVANVSFLQDAVFIAGTGPDVILRLITELRDARATITQLLKDLEGCDDHCAEAWDEGHRTDEHGAGNWMCQNPYRSGDE